MLAGVMVIGAWEGAEVAGFMSRLAGVIVMALLLPKLMSCCSNFACSDVIVDAAGFLGLGPRLL